MLINNEFIHIRTYEVEKPKATIVFSHGIAEHHLRYKTLIDYLNESGYNVLAYDLRGHGKSGGKRGYIKSANVYVEDLNYLIGVAKEKYNQKVFLIGHSLGALIGNLYLISRSFDELNVDGVVGSGTAGNYQKASNILRYLPVNLLWFVKIKTNFKDPNLYQDPTQTINFVKDDFLLDSFYLTLIDRTMIKGMRRLKKSMSKIETPYLFVHGEDDNIIPIKSSKNLFNHIKSTDKIHKVYPGLKHNILNDNKSLEVFKDIVQWLNERI
ncbi:MAG: alpha/beta fold hydrolase [Acholeplasmataceae bacterium]